MGSEQAQYAYVDSDTTRSEQRALFKGTAVGDPDSVYDQSSVGDDPRRVDAHRSLQLSRKISFEDGFQVGYDWCTVDRPPDNQDRQEQNGQQRYYEWATQTHPGFSRDPIGTEPIRAVSFTEDYPFDGTAKQPMDLTYASVPSIVLRKDGSGMHTAAQPRKISMEGRPWL